MKPLHPLYSFEDPDDEGCSWQSMYRMCGVEVP